jgi:uncharacterized repeat protein (TIGR03837 family)
MRWDIFCHVIDNYGDIGVCWRLSQQLATEYGMEVRMLVDDIVSLQHICPDIDVGLKVQNYQGVEVWQWVEPFPDLIPAEVVIEAFGCELPANYVEAMVSTVPRFSDRIHDKCSSGISSNVEQTKRIWVNLEYLSAEQWVEGCHGLASPHPRLPLTKYFFFPGFTTATGGLLREAGLLTQRDALQRDPAALRYRFNLPASDSAETVISLFCYDSAPVGNLLNAWVASTARVYCLVPESRILTQIANWAERPNLAVGDSIRRSSLTLRIIPFVPQEDYDRLLWTCDCNFVRGEDSFVRAQWAARPLVWQIYPQQDDAHRVKLDAFLDRYCQGLEESTTALRTFHQNWNNGGQLDWDSFWQHRTALQHHAMTWAEQLAQTDDLAANLVRFCKNRQYS